MYCIHGSANNGAKPWTWVKLMAFVLTCLGKNIGAIGLHKMAMAKQWTNQNQYKTQNPIELREILNVSRKYNDQQLKAMHSKCQCHCQCNEIVKSWKVIDEVSGRKTERVKEKIKTSETKKSNFCCCCCYCCSYCVVGCLLRCWAHFCIYLLIYDTYAIARTKCAIAKKKNTFFFRSMYENATGGTNALASIASLLGYCSFSCFRTIVHLNSLWIWKNQSKPTACERLICFVHFHQFARKWSHEHSQNQTDTNTLQAQTEPLKNFKSMKITRWERPAADIDPKWILPVRRNSNQFQHKNSRKPQNQSTLNRFLQSNKPNNLKRTQNSWPK